MSSLKQIESLLESEQINVLEEILDLVMEEVFAERGCLWFHQTDRLIYCGDEELRKAFPFSRKVVYNVLDEGRGFVSWDPSVDARSSASKSLKTFGIRSVLCAPVQDRKGDMHAILYFDNGASEGVFGEDDLKFLTEVAQLLSSFFSVD